MAVGILDSQPGFLRPFALGEIDSASAQAFAGDAQVRNRDANLVSLLADEARVVVHAYRHSGNFHAEVFAFFLIAHRELQRIHVEATRALQVRGANGKEIQAPDGKREGNVANVCSEKPGEAESIPYAGVAVAVRLVGGRHNRGGAGAHSTLIGRISIGHVEVKGARHRAELAVSLANLQRVVANLHGDVQDGAFGRAGNVAQDFGAERVLQEFHELVGTAGMQHGLDRGRASSRRCPADRGGDVPQVAELVLHAALAVAVVLIYRRKDRSRARGQGTSVNRIGVADVDVELGGPGWKLLVG